MRATLRLITVWVSVTIAIVALGWSGLRAAVTAATHGDTDGFSTLDSAALGHRPGAAWSDRAGGGGDVRAPEPAQRGRAPSTVADPAHVRPRPIGRPPMPQGPASPMPPLAESPSPPVPIASPVVPTPDPSPSVAMATTTVQTQGGILVLYAENGVVAVDRAAPEQGFTTRSLPGYDGSLLFQFVSAKHVSEVFAYVDANYITQFSIDERDL